MKKLFKERWRIELQIRKNNKKTKSENKVDKNLKHRLHVSLPPVVGLLAKKARDPLLNIINTMEQQNTSKSSCYLDFKKVKTLHPDGTIHLLHHIDKYKDLYLIGRTADDSTVRAMLSKLKIHDRLELPTYTKSHNLIDNWHIFTGNSATFDEEYLQIEKVLQEALGEESELFFTLNDAIGEAVTNAVHHGYSPNDQYKTWILFLSISAERCAVIVSDLGKTIPVSAPLTLADKMRVPRLFFQGKKDEECIEIASTWRKSSTNQSHRGRGFDNILEVCKEENGAIVRILSRKGGWSTKEGKIPYTTSIRGTIISWVIPLLSITDKQAA